MVSPLPCDCWPKRTKHRGHRQRLRLMNRPRCLENIKLGTPISRSRGRPPGTSWPRGGLAIDRSRRRCGRRAEHASAAAGRRTAAPTPTGIRRSTPRTISDRPAAGPRRIARRSRPSPFMSTDCAARSNRGARKSTRSPARSGNRPPCWSHHQLCDQVGPHPRDPHRGRRRLGDRVVLAQDERPGARREVRPNCSTGSKPCSAPQYPDYLADQIRPCWPNHPESRRDWPGLPTVDPHLSSQTTEPQETQPSAMIGLVPRRTPA